MPSLDRTDEFHTNATFIALVSPHLHVLMSLRVWTLFPSDTDLAANLQGSHARGSIHLSMAAKSTAEDIPLALHQRENLASCIAKSFGYRKVVSEQVETTSSWQRSRKNHANSHMEQLVYLCQYFGEVFVKFLYEALTSCEGTCTLVSAFPTNINLLTLATKNLSNSNRYPDLPNDSFSYFVRYGSPTISATSCMMLAVFAMRELALQDLESNFEGKTWALYIYPDVKVSFTPKSGLISTVRWALWSLAVAIRHMPAHNRFQTALFETHYSQVQVGTVKFFVPYCIGAETGANQTGLSPSLTPAPASATDGTDTILISSSDLEDNPGGLLIQVAFKTTGIPRMDIFMSIVQGLLNLAPQSSTGRITKPLAVVGDALTFSIATSFTSMERSAPPFLRYSHVGLTLAALPRLILREGKFVEVDVKWLLDDQVIGNGTMRRGPRINLPALVTANLSVS